VLIGPPLPYGLSGPEAEAIYRILLSQVRSEGSQAVGGQGLTASALPPSGAGQGVGGGAGAGAGGAPGGP
jgi:hypothetical protein